MIQIFVFKIKIKIKNEYAVIYIKPMIILIKY